MTDVQFEASASTVQEVDRWEAFGEYTTVDGHRIWCRRVPARSDVGRPPLLVLHGFPTCSYDWRPVLDDLSERRDVVLFDFVGFGLSDKPDVRYGLRRSADAAEAVAAHFGLGHVDLLTHDMGDSVGGEVLARSIEGTLPFTIGRRVISNGSIYLDMAQLTVGQNLLMSLPDAAEPLVGADGGASFRNGVMATFAPDSPVDAAEMDALTLLAARADGLALLPRTIRYLEDRRAEEARFTGAIEAHDTPLGVVWGALDPVAVHAMAVHLVDQVPAASLVTLDGVGHYPMVEAPRRFADAVLGFLDA
ncbi:MAG: alpha/beta hydrolase [Aquihabitans sp.]